jgi:hypothetical protein
MVKQQLILIVVYHQLRDTPAISQRKQAIFQLDGSEDRYVLEQHALLDFHSARSLKQKSTDKHVKPLRQRILIHTP